MKTQEIYNLIVKWFVSLFERKPKTSTEPVWETEIMKKFGKITNQITKEQYNTDLLRAMNLVREKYHGVTPKVIDYNELPGTERTGAIERLTEIGKDKTFQMVCDKLIDNQKEEVLYQAANYDEVMFGRATVNGIELIREILADAATQSDELHKKKEPFDKFKVLPE